MKIFVHINNSSSLHSIDVDKDHKVGSLVSMFANELVKSDDSNEDVEVYLEDHDDDIDKGVSFDEAGIKGGSLVFVGRCKKIPVTVNYAGNFFTASFGPATSMKHLRKLAIKHFGIDEISGADLKLWFNDKPLDARVLLGSLTDYPTMGVGLVLAAKRDINGDVSHEIFKDHLDSPEYQFGEHEGRWGIVENENGPNWPILVFWVAKGTDLKFNFKFDLSDYPNSAPTAVIWDVACNGPLSEAQRPNGTKREQQVFKKWGKECNYLPCDRMALEGHGDWPSVHPDLIWNNRKDTLLKYLNELFQILNP